jgi:chemotaxis protein methyltransferase CheR
VSAVDYTNSGSTACSSDDEWSVVDSMFRINITRFYRDKEVFTYVREVILPIVERIASRRGDPAVRVWSAGCSTGEEVWTLKVLTSVNVANHHHGGDSAGGGGGGQPAWEFVGTDVHPPAVDKAKDCIYGSIASLKLMPEDIRKAAFRRVVDGEPGFTSSGTVYTLTDGLKQGVSFEVQDIRQQRPTGSFHLILARHSIFMYFDMPLRLKMLKYMLAILAPGGYLIVGMNDRLPQEASAMGLHAAQGANAGGIYQYGSPAI